MSQQSIGAIVVPPNPTFIEVAKKVLKKSIRSAVCIDDRLVEPYMSQEEIKQIEDNCGEKLDDGLARDLYRSFRIEGECDLDVYCFKSLEESWRPNYMLNNKDLVVLDWELDGKGMFESTIKILTEIIEIGRIPFVIIYTYKPAEEFLEISKEIAGNFNPYGKLELQERKKNFLEIFSKHISKVSENKEIDQHDIELFWEDERTIGILDEYFLTPSKIDETYIRLVDSIAEKFEIKNTESANKKFKTVLNEAFGLSEGSFSSLVFLITGAKNEQKYFFARIEIEDLGFRINDTIVTIFSKPGETNNGVTPQNVFTKFSNLISNAPHNFITILSLEMRDRFREDIIQIGSEISKIDEKAFFHHHNKYMQRVPNYQNEFFDFLLRSWTNELSEFNLNQTPIIFETIEEYKNSKGYNDIVGNNIQSSLANLGVILSTTNIKQRKQKDKRIRFGDLFQVFIISETGEEAQEEFMLSITPHCVCLDECKIENNFYFIKSENVSKNYTSALKDIEKDYYSFCKCADEISAIKWGGCKPFTLYIALNDLNNLRANYTNKHIRLEYITTLKENFAQRLSNKAFGYGTSIGIDLPHL